MFFDDGFDPAALPLPAQYGAAAELPALCLNRTPTGEFASGLMVESTTDTRLQPPCNEMAEQVGRAQLWRRTEAFRP